MASLRVKIFLGPFQNLFSARGKFIGIHVKGGASLHDHQSMKPHVLHGPCYGTDVLVKFRPDENDRDRIEIYSLFHDPYYSFPRLP